MFKKLVGVAMSALLTVSLFSGAMITANAVSGVQNNPSPDASANELTRSGGDTQATSTEMAAYLFVHFVGTEENADKEQIYFSVSQNGTRWKTLNAKQPILRSTVGEQGVRDPNIIRKPDGSGFYLIATDLSIFHLGEQFGNDKWGVSQTAGSKSIVVWESENLVDWDYVGDGLHEIARENATCTWAPEVIYDDEREAYMVYWASKTEEDWQHRVYRSYTTDFETFTAPEVYIEGDVSLIDTTFIKEGDTYYRFTKNEAATYVYMEKSKSLSGDFVAVNTFTINGSSHTSYTGYEGPTAYKLNGEDKWCLLLDNYGRSAGYKPFVTDDISKGRFASAASFNFGGVNVRHGSVMPITQAEYDALLAAYPFTEDVEESQGTGELVYALDFEDNLDAATGTQVATANGTLGYESGVNGGRAIKISGNGNFVSIDGSMLQGLNSFTVSFAAKFSGKSWAFFAAPDANEQVYRSEKYIGAVADGGTLTCERYNSNDKDRPAAATGAYTADEWVHVTLVYRAGTLRVFVNGYLEGKVDSSVNLADMLGATPLIQLGKANWDNGEYSNMLLDCFKIHNYELSADEVFDLYQSDMGRS